MHAVGLILVVFGYFIFNTYEESDCGDTCYYNAIPTLIYWVLTIIYGINLLKLPGDIFYLISVRKEDDSDWVK